ncbi:unannotated protein [freshwater metagenome]|uniref:Unannotated protein n=1 Tax=freshwater metagenome TaxID=449393 RepID=A0A6J6ET41_9ZZZZ
MRKTITQIDSTSMARGRQPMDTATADTAAIPAARTTDGSTRVSTANHTSAPSVAESRVHRPRRRSNGVTIASTYPTFCPDTAVRCARPLSRNRSTVPSLCAESSPYTNPANSAASSSLIVDAPRAMTSRTSLAERSRARDRRRAPPSGSEMDSTSNIPTM